MSPYPDHPGSRPSVARIGRWIIPAIPYSWSWVPDFGIQHTGENTVPSNVYLKEDELLPGNQLVLYVQTQIVLMKRTFENPMIAGPAPIRFEGAEESLMLMLKHRPMNQMSVIQVQHYIRIAKWIGIATLTTLETELLKVRPDFEQFMKMLRIAEAPVETS